MSAAATHVIVNPGSGGVDDLSEVLALIRGRDDLRADEIRVCGAGRSAGGLAVDAVEAGAERIVAAGGDGTVNAVVDAVLTGDRAGEVAVGVLPLGTGNDFARSLGIPLDLEGALDALGRAIPGLVDAVRAEEFGRFFVNASASGFSGEVDEQVTPERKRRWGPFAYARGALDLLPDPETYRLSLTVDGTEEELDVLNVVVANGRTVAGGIEIAPGALLDDGALDLVVVRAGSAAEIAAFCSSCLVGTHLEHDLVEHRRAGRVRLESVPPMPVNVDGDLVGETPVEYEIRPGALRILLPPDRQVHGERKGEMNGEMAGDADRETAGGPAAGRALRG